MLPQPDVHTARFVDALNADPDAFGYVALPSMSTEKDFLERLYDPEVRDSKETCLYAVIDRTVSDESSGVIGRYAGISSLNKTDPGSAKTEIGVIIFPDSRGAHVANNAIGLLLLWTLDPPSIGGLGLRRVEWFSHADNAASRKVAQRLGFEFEGVARWQRTHPYAKFALSTDALKSRNGTKDEAPGRHTAMYSITWDEWDEKRPRVLEVMGRTTQTVVKE